MSNTGSAHVIGIFGRPAGILVAAQSRFVFRATDRIFWELERYSFKSLFQAEKAIYEVWFRDMHRHSSDRRSTSLRI